MFDSQIVQIVLTLAVVIAAQIILRDVLDRLVHRVLQSHKFESKTEEHQREETLARVFRTLSTAIVWVIGGVVILGELHVHLAALLTGAGLVGIVIGLGAQNVLKDCLAGIMVIIENQYRVGDVVSMSAGLGSPVAGIVEDISIRATRLRDLDGDLHIIPNGSAGIVTNKSYKFANVYVRVRVNFDADINKVERIINEIGEELSRDEAWADHTVEPIKFLRIDDFDNAGMTVIALGRVKPAAQWDIAGAFRRRLKAAFQKHGIKFA